MAEGWPDEQIAATLNRIGLKTGTGRTWNESSVYMLRQRLKLPVFDATRPQRTTLTLTEAAQALGMSSKIVRRLIDEGHLPAKQAAKYGPFEIQKDGLDSPVVRGAARDAHHAGRSVRNRAAVRRTLPLPGLDEP
jgi:excisionase family DNA binding protein